jgi:Xaa-Pro aminopeptidase
VENYAADITRTYALGVPSKRQQQVSEAVQDVQKFALKLLKPGTSLRDYEQKVEELMGEKLLELGLIKTAEQRNIRRYYPHSTSHFLGLDVHDVGNYEQPLAAGMVLTVEPGIYIPEEKIGVRIEDDVLITKNGVEVLSKKLPPTLLQLS